MTPEELAQQAADTAEGWRQANIARVFSEMHRYGLTLVDLIEADAEGRIEWIKDSVGRIIGANRVV